MTVTIRRATVEDAKRLNELMLTGLEDKANDVYRENIERFGIPEEYVRQVFSFEALKKAVTDTNQLFLVAIEDQTLMGFAQTIRQSKETAELDRIFLLPEYTGKGIGTQLLKAILDVLKTEGISRLSVKAGRDETLARRFYEKNGFRLVQETTIRAPWGRDLSLAIYELRIMK